MLKEKPDNQLPVQLKKTSPQLRVKWYICHRKQLDIIFPLVLNSVRSSFKPQLLPFLREEKLSLNYLKVLNILYIKSL
jgi:hypothetical protein